VVAVSGGADSVALLCALHDAVPGLGVSLAVAHLNHCIRGRASDRDAEFVRKLAARLDIPFVCGKVDVPRLARRTGLSMEMAARQARYSFLVKAARRLKAKVIVTAHTADDQAETVLLKLARGAGPRGLAGIPREITVSGIRVVRPLLDTRRREIERFLRVRKQDWREDRTNVNTEYLRNRVRHEVIPFLEKKLNPDIRQALVRTADVLRREDEWLEETAGRILEKCRVDSGSALDISMLKKNPVAARRRVVRQWLSASGIPAETIDYDVITRVEALIDGEGTGSVEITGRRTVRRRYNRLVVGASRPETKRKTSQKIQVPGVTLLKDWQLKIETALAPGLTKERGVIGGFPARASIRMPPGNRTIVVRSWQNGDRMRPLGMQGTKKLHNIFIDAKVPVEERGKVPVFECDGDIIWIPGYRVARGWEVKTPSAGNLQIRVERAGQ